MMDVFKPQPPTSTLVASICRCSSSKEHADRAISYAQEQARATVTAANARAAELASRTPNPDSFAVEEVEQVGEHLVMKVRYPNCALCAYEGCKVMVFLNTTLKAAIKWRRVDPHFRAPVTRAQLTTAAVVHEAPSPAARFPASKDGWTDALTYAQSKV